MYLGLFIKGSHGKGISLCTCRWKEICVNVFLKYRVHSLFAVSRLKSKMYLGFLRAVYLHTVGSIFCLSVGDVCLLQVLVKTGLLMFTCITWTQFRNHIWSVFCHMHHKCSIMCKAEENKQRKTSWAFKHLLKLETLFRKNIVLLVQCFISWYLNSVLCECTSHINGTGSFSALGYISWHQWISSG